MFDPSHKCGLDPRNLDTRAEAVLEFLEFKNVWGLLQLGPCRVKLHSWGQTPLVETLSLYVSVSVRVTGWHRSRDMLKAFFIHTSFLPSRGPRTHARLSHWSVRWLRHCATPEPFLNVSSVHDHRFVKNRKCFRAWRAWPTLLLVFIETGQRDTTATTESSPYLHVPRKSLISRNRQLASSSSRPGKSCNPTQSRYCSRTGPTLSVRRVLRDLVLNAPPCSRLSR